MLGESAILLTTGCVIGLAAGASAGWAALRRQTHPALRQRVLVNIAEEAAGLRGFLAACRGEYLVLEQAEVCPPNESATRVDGAIVLERRRVLFVQVLPGQSRTP